MTHWLFWVRSLIAHYRGVWDLKRGRYVTLEELEREIDSD